MTGTRLLMAGFAGLTGTAAVASERRGELETVLPRWLLDRAEAFAGRSYRREIEALAWNAGPAGDAGLAGLPRESAGAFGWPVGEGGVQAALWLFAEALGCGMDASLQAVPIRQETVEICEALDIDPYRLAGDGYLLAAPGGDAFPAFLEARGIRTVPIGKLLPGRTRLLRVGENEGCLNKPRYLPRERWEMGPLRRLDPGGTT